MKHIIPINEYVKDEMDFKWVLKNLITQLQKITYKNITSDNIRKEDGKHIYTLQLLNLPIKFTFKSKIESLLNKAQSELLKINYFLSYHVGMSKGYDLDKELENELELKPNDKEYMSITIYVKTIYSMRAVVPDILYHYTDSKNIENIRLNGLLPSEPINYIGSTSLHYPPLVFASKNKEAWKGKKDTLVMFKKGNRKYWQDLNFVGRYGAEQMVMTNEPIPPSDIVYVKKLQLNQAIVNEQLEYQLEGDFIYYFIDSKKIGYIEYYYVGGVFSEHISKKHKEFYISMIEVYKEFRGNDYASQMLNHIKIFAKQKGATIITLRVDEGSGGIFKRNSNVGLEKLYLKNGFKYLHSKDEISKDSDKNIGAMYFEIKN